jgi:hypothetical protein
MAAKVLYVVPVSCCYECYTIFDLFCEDALIQK